MMNISKAKILSSIVGLLMIIVLVKPFIGAGLLGILGAGLWIKGEDYIK